MQYFYTMCKSEQKKTQQKCEKLKQKKNNDNKILYKIKKRKEKSNKNMRH